MRILLVDDNPLDISAIMNMVKHVDETGEYRLESATRLSAAKQLLNSESFDLVLLDLSLPDSYGIETFESLNQCFPELPIVIMSGHEDYDTMLTSMQKGAFHYLSKSTISLYTLKETLDNFRACVNLRRHLADCLKQYNDDPEFTDHFNAIIGAHDPQIAQHQIRVAQLATCIAEEMGDLSEQIKDIYLAALIHDFGKLLIIPMPVNQNRNLRELVDAINQEHPRIAYALLKQNHFPSTIADAVLQHHELIDGSGYPCGLQQEIIGLGTRILSVANIVESIASSKTSHPIGPIDRALIEIVNFQGTRYDERIVHACVRLFWEKNFQWT